MFAPSFKCKIKCPTSCNSMYRSMPGLPVHHQLPEFTQTHVHRVGDAIQPSHPLSSPSPPAPNPSQHQGLFQWVSSLHEVVKVLEFQLQHQSFQWTPRTDLLQDGLVGSPCSPRDSQESSPAPQFKSISVKLGGSSHFLLQWAKREDIGTMEWGAGLGAQAVAVHAWGLLRETTVIFPPPPLLGHGLSPVGCHTWPQTWGSSSQPLPLTSDVG